MGFCLVTTLSQLLLSTANFPGAEKHMQVYLATAVLLLPLKQLPVSSMPNAGFHSTCWQKFSGFLWDLKLLKSCWRLQLKNAQINRNWDSKQASSSFKEWYFTKEKCWSGNFWPVPLNSLIHFPSCKINYFSFLQERCTEVQLRSKHLEKLSVFLEKIVAQMWKIRNKEIYGYVKDLINSLCSQP